MVVLYGSPKKENMIWSCLGERILRSKFRKSQSLKKSRGRRRKTVGGWGEIDKEKPRYFFTSTVALGDVEKRD